MCEVKWAVMNQITWERDARRVTVKIIFFARFNFFRTILDSLEDSLVKKFDIDSSLFRNPDQQNGSQVFDENADRNTWAETRREADFTFSSTPSEGRLPKPNGGYVKFEEPKVPVIFVLGGPGSGKVTHGDNLMHEKRGITHINMTDLLQQYAIGNGKFDSYFLSHKFQYKYWLLNLN